MVEARKKQAAIIPDIHPACDISINESVLASKKMPPEGGRVSRLPRQAR
ncbi:hypothetical protein [Vogesella mureinivorans]|nr:hypothetical protein [Vogesella mureinivorans]